MTQLVIELSKLYACSQPRAVFAKFTHGSSAQNNHISRWNASNIAKERTFPNSLVIINSAAINMEAKISIDDRTAGIHLHPYVFKGQGSNFTQSFKICFSCRF
jgi:hypothetical protein